MEKEKYGIGNKHLPSIYGIGYLGTGDYKAKINKKLTKEYNIWLQMLGRCYDKKCQEKNPTYKGVVVCEEWLNFQNFAKWYDNSYPKAYGVKFELDKDLLQENVDNKIYSPDTCTFLPKNINVFLSNKHSNNTSSYAGVSFYKANKKWTSKIKLFGEDKRKYLGYFPTPELASQSYQQARAEQSEKVKDYLRSLNYLPEETIQLVK